MEDNPVDKFMTLQNNNNDEKKKKRKFSQVLF